MFSKHIIFALSYIYICIILYLTLIHLTLYLHYLISYINPSNTASLLFLQFNCKQYLSVFNVFFRIVTQCMHFILDYSFDRLFAYL